MHVVIGDADGVRRTQDLDVAAHEADVTPHLAHIPGAVP
jgi:hypothetical protein